MAKKTITVRVGIDLLAGFRQSVKRVASRARVREGRCMEAALLAWMELNDAQRIERLKRLANYELESAEISQDRADAEQIVSAAMRAQARAEKRRRSSKDE